MRNTSTPIWRCHFVGFNINKCIKSAKVRIYISPNNSFSLKYVFIWVRYVLLWLLLYRISKGNKYKSRRSASGDKREELKINEKRLVIQQWRQVCILQTLKSTSQYHENLISQRKYTWLSVSDKNKQILSLSQLRGILHERSFSNTIISIQYIAMQMV